MSKVLIAGSYDPITNGHLSLIRTCAALFDQVHVVAFINAEKTAVYPTSLREQMLRVACAPFTNVVTGSDSGYVVDYAERHEIPILVRGIRNENDLSYELHMANNNRKFNPSITTMFLPADPSVASVSSSTVRDRLARAEKITDLVPPGVAELIAEYERYAR